jgi:hypothetical protein
MEIWKTIEQDTNYQASTQGRVKNLLNNKIMEPKQKGRLMHQNISQLRLT